MGKSTRWLAALGAAGAIAGGGAALASVPLPATASGKALVTSELTHAGVATQAKELAAQAAALQHAIGTARAQLAHLAGEKGGQLAARQAALDAEAQQLDAEQTQLSGEAQQLAAEQTRLQQEAAALAASSKAPTVHATTGASGAGGGDE